MADYVKITRKKDRLREKLNALVPGVNAAINDANEKSARELLEAVKSAAPEDTGDYKKRLKIRALGDGDISTTRRIKGGKSIKGKAAGVNAWGLFALFWWKALEFGVSGKGARPHILPIYRSLRKRFRSRLSRAVNKKIKQVSK